MSKVYRVYLDDEGDAHGNITLDIVTDDGGQPRPRIPFCGWWGKIGSTDFIPIVVHPNGRVDTGSYEETNQAERYGEIDIISKRLDLGQGVRFEIWGDEYNFKITRKIDLSDF